MRFIPLYESRVRTYPAEPGPRARRDYAMSFEAPLELLGFQAAAVRKPTVVSYHLSFRYLHRVLSGTFPKTMYGSPGATWCKSLMCQ
jgi:hypothetical protein